MRDKSDYFSNVDQFCVKCLMHCSDVKHVKGTIFKLLVACQIKDVGLDWTMSKRYHASYISFESYNIARVIGTWTGVKSPH